MKTCCESGYTYNVLTGKCSAFAAAVDRDPVDCPCCPKGSVYVDQDGYFIQDDPLRPSYGQRVQVSNPPPYTGISGTCVNIFNGTWAVPFTNETVDCPCCYANTNDWYNNIDGMCVDNITNIEYDPIPCIPCICPDPITPVPCETCQENSGLHISFAYNPFIKQCQDCIPQDFVPPTDPKLNCFIPYFIILPNTNNFTTE